jgi:hypothetical protein
MILAYRSEGHFGCWWGVDFFRARPDSGVRQNYP